MPAFGRSNPRSVPPRNDALGETLHLLRLDASLYARSELTAPWGIDLPPIDDCLMFHVVTAGRCVLEVEDEVHVLERGSLALVPHGRGHVLRSEDCAAAKPFFDLQVERLSERYELLRYGGGGARTELLCVVSRFDHVAAEHLVALLPRVIVIETWNTDEANWIHGVLACIATEARQMRPGGETIITRLADVLAIHLIRAWLDRPQAADTGWLAGMRDPQIGAALAAFQREPAAPWTLASLAEAVHMSRSAFAARFTEVVGEPAMRYVTRWRMQLARHRLREGSEPLAALSEELGYASEASFCRAFKREFGVSPGRVRLRAGA
ncbi:MAG: AraC family transcriptional regulator [Planctomycetota bacterium]